MKLAVRKEAGQIPGGGYHYMLVPMQLDEWQVKCFYGMGHIIIDVPDDRGVELIKEAGNAINHQLNVAILTEKAIAAGDKI